MTGFISKIIEKLKDTQNEVSSTVVLISQISIFSGVFFIYLAFSIGLGMRYAIKEKLAAFSGHVLITAVNTNESYDSTSFSNREFPHEVSSWKTPVTNISDFAIKVGIIRTKKHTEGILLKGVSFNYNWSGFKDFIIKGRSPDLKKTSLSYEVLISKKIASYLALDVGSSFLVYFFRESLQIPIVRRFLISGLYSTGIKNFDETLIIGDLKQVRRINQWQDHQVGGIEVFAQHIDDIETLESEIKTHIHQGLKAQGVLTRFEDIRNWMEIFDVNILIVTLIISLVVIINIVVLLLILILERSYTVGVLKTLGASNISIRRMFIFYTFLVLLPPLLWGNLIALGLLFLQKKFGWVRLDPQAYYLSVVPVYIHPVLIISINISTLLLFLFTLWWLPSILINKISPIRFIKFC